MVAPLLLGVCLLGGAPSPANVDREYESARSSAGRDPDAHVKLALWCEAHGLHAKSLKHLALAVLIDRNHAKARGLLGLVSFRGRWESPDAAVQKAAVDEALAARLAQYNRLRAELPTKHKGTTAAVFKARARDEVKLALWCEENGLKPEAVAHFTSATRLDPSSTTAWEHLGCRKHNGRWMTPEQIAAEAAEREAQRHADRHWEPLLRTWKQWLEQPLRRAQAEQHFAEITEARAVPSVWKVFGRGGPSDQHWAVRMLSQIDGPEATRALADLAVFGATDDVRALASKALPARDPRIVIPALIRQFHAPVRYTYIPPVGRGFPFHGSSGSLLVEGEKAGAVRTYLPGVAVNPAERSFANMLSFQNMARDVQAIELRNEIVEQTNPRVASLLSALTGEKLGVDAEEWDRWWFAQQGYDYEPPNPARKPVYATIVNGNGYEGRPGRDQNAVLRAYGLLYNPRDCFAAGTRVHTLSGLRPIESIQVGDRVLAQDPRSGELDFQPVVAIYRHPPYPTRRLAVGAETVATTGIHRFWKAGQGWTAARDLKPGDVLRVVGGTATVVTNEPGEEEPVYTLDVARFGSFFVGSAGLLVHDHSLVQPTNRAFDAPPELAGAMTEKRTAPDHARPRTSAAH